MTDIERYSGGAGLARIYDVDDPASVVKVATDQAARLAHVVENSGMYTVMGTRTVTRDLGDGRTAEVREVQKHINVEAWQFIGIMTGVTARTVWTRKLFDEEYGEPEMGHPFPPVVGQTWRPPTLEWAEEQRSGRNGPYTKRVQRPVPGKEGVGGWEARVELVANGEVIAAAEAECRWDEERWATSSSSAVRSMAQTRAESKAYRSVFGWIPKMAGYNPTPEEEMVEGGARAQAMDRVPAEVTDAQRLVWSKQAALFHAPDRETAVEWWEAGMLAAGFERPGQVKNLGFDQATTLLEFLQEMATSTDDPFGDDDGEVVEPDEVIEPEEAKK